MSNYYLFYFMLYLKRDHNCIIYFFRNSKSQADIQLTISSLDIKKQHNFKFKYPKGMILYKVFQIITVKY